MEMTKGSLFDPGFGKSFLKSRCEVSRIEGQSQLRQALLRTMGSCGRPPVVSSDAALSVGRHTSRPLVRPIILRFPKPDYYRNLEKRLPQMLVPFAGTSIHPKRRYCHGPAVVLFARCTNAAKPVWLYNDRRPGISVEIAEVKLFSVQSMVPCIPDV